MLLEPDSTCKMEDRIRTDFNQPMEQNYYAGSSFSDRSTDSPLSDKVSSAADAMLKLSTSFPNPINSNHGIAIKSESFEYSASHDSDNDHNSDADGKHDSLNRRERSFVPEGNKDDHYWTKRRKNNEAAKKSREKRRMQDQILAHNVAELKKENEGLRCELELIKRHYGYPVNVDFDPGLAPLARKPVPEPVVVQPSSSPMTTVFNTASSPLVLPGASARPALPIPVIPESIPPTAHNQPATPHVVAPLSLSVAHSHVSNGLQSMTSQPCVLDVKPVIELDRKRRNSDEIALDYSCPKTSKTESNDISYDHSNIHNDNSTHSNEAGIMKIEPSTGSNSPVSSPPITGQTYEGKGIPHKLRHKYKSISFSSTVSENIDDGIVMDIKHDSEPELKTSSYFSRVSQSDTDTSTGETEVAAKSKSYGDRRKRNNIAARKCREHKRMLTKMQIANVDILEEENSKLKGQMQNLSGELKYLKELIRQKSEAQMRGEIFEPSVKLLDKLDQRDNA